VTKSSTHLQARGFASLLLFIHLLVPGGVFSQAHPQRRTAAPLAWPQITQQMKPWTRWWWQGSVVNGKDLTTELEKYRRAGLGGVEITPIYGVKGEEGRFIKFLSPQWMAMLQHAERGSAAADGC